MADATQTAHDIYDTVLALDGDQTETLTYNTLAGRLTETDYDPSPDAKLRFANPSEEVASVTDDPHIQVTITDTKIGIAVYHADNPSDGPSFYPVEAEADRPEIKTVTRDEFVEWFTTYATSPDAIGTDEELADRYGQVTDARLAELARSHLGPRSRVAFPYEKLRDKTPLAAPYADRALRYLFEEGHYVPVNTSFPDPLDSDGNDYYGNSGVFDAGDEIEMDTKKGTTHDESLVEHADTFRLNAEAVKSAITFNNTELQMTNDGRLWLVTASQPGTETVDVGKEFLELGEPTQSGVLRFEPSAFIEETPDKLDWNRILDGMMHDARSPPEYEQYRRFWANVEFIDHLSTDGHAGELDVDVVYPDLIDGEPEWRNID